MQMSMVINLGEGRGLCCMLASVCVHRKGGWRQLGRVKKTIDHASGFCLRGLEWGWQFESGSGGFGGT